MFPPGFLWGGPYPLYVGSMPPTQVKVWFNTITNALLTWNYLTLSWIAVAPTVIVAAAPPSGGVGTLWMDSQQKLWVKVDDFRELTMPLPINLISPNSAPPVALNGAKLTTSLASITESGVGGAPANPVNGDVWFEPLLQNLYIWSGFQWFQIGMAVQRNVRNGNYAGCWNAGGNRGQASAAGGLLYVAGIRGINPLTQAQLPGPGPQNQLGLVAPNTAANGNARIDQIYQNIKTIVEAEGLTLFDCLGIDTYLASNAYIGATAAEQALPQFWGAGPYPNRTHITMIQMSGSDQEQEFGPGTSPPLPAGQGNVAGWPARGDIVEVTSLFSLAKVGRRSPNALSDAVMAIPGVSMRAW
jgi:enamine deaminase RidA (YjgF/YER057c/UK114 family)